MGELLLREVSVGHAERSSHSLDTTSDTIAMVESCSSPLGRLRPPDSRSAIAPLVKVLGLSHARGGHWRHDAQAAPSQRWIARCSAVVRPKWRVPGIDDDIVRAFAPTVLAAHRHSSYAEGNRYRQAPFPHLSPSTGFSSLRKPSRANRCGADYSGPEKRNRIQYRSV